MVHPRPHAKQFGDRKKKKATGQDRHATSDRTKFSQCIDWYTRNNTSYARTHQARQKTNANIARAYKCASQRGGKTRTSFRRPFYKKKRPQRERKRKKKQEARENTEHTPGMRAVQECPGRTKRSGRAPTHTHTLTGDAAALQKKTRSRLCWCLVCNCVCVCLRRGTRRRAHRESNAPARQCGAARPVTLGHPAGSLGTTSTLRDLQSFTRFHLQTYESGEGGSGTKKRGFLAVLRVSRSTTST